MKRLPIVLLAAALLACTQGRADIGGLDYAPLYYQGIVPLATASGELNVVVRGNPFGSAGTDDAALVAALPKPGTATPFNYKAVAASAPGRHYYVVLVFNPSVAAAGDNDSCAHPGDEPYRPGGGPITVKAVFCVADHWASSLVGFGEPASGPQDPRFQALMRQTIALLLPADQPASNHGSAGQLLP